MVSINSEREPGLPGALAWVCNGRVDLLWTLAETSSAIGSPRTDNTFL